jgi:glutathione S-transferase
VTNPAFAGLPYKTRLLGQGDQDKPGYRLLQPFGQVPIFEEDGLVLFESGAIVLQIAQRSETLLPKDPAALWPRPASRSSAMRTIRVDARWQSEPGLCFLLELQINPLIH